MEIDENLSSSERALLQRVAEHLRKFRYSHREDDYPPLYRDGVLAGIEMAKNEVWRLAGSRPF